MLNTYGQFILDANKNVKRTVDTETLMEIARIKRYMEISRGGRWSITELL